MLAIQDVQHARVTCARLLMQVMDGLANQESPSLFARFPSTESIITYILYGSVSCSRKMIAKLVQIRACGCEFALDGIAIHEASIFYGVTHLLTHQADSPAASFVTFSQGLVNMRRFRKAPIRHCCLSCICRPTRTSHEHFHLC